MNTKILMFTITSMLICSSAFAQLMTFGFVKNCMTYKRETVTNELTKKHFFIVNRRLQEADHKMLVGATYYSNQKEAPAKGEIRVLSLINESEKITEISFIKGSDNDYSDNYKEVFKQMLAFFNNESTFKSSKFKTDVSMFAKDKMYYYAFIHNETPTIVISDRKMEADYFSKE